MTTLQMEKELLQKWHHLPDEKRQAVLDFTQSPGSGTPPKAKPLQSALGLCADLRATISGDAIDEARRELWRGFPRDDF